MIGYDLPASVNVGGRDFAIRTDYRAILDIVAAMNDPELTEEDRTVVALGIFYEDEIPEDLQEAVDKCLWFISGGDDKKADKPQPKLVDWEKDFKWIAAPITKAFGQDVRAVKMHWWTFLAYYYEIGECTFSQIVKIRSARATGKKLDKDDLDWARKNADLVYIEQKYSQAEEDLISAWTRGGQTDAE